jgi:lysozyme
MAINPRVVDLSHHNYDERDLYWDAAKRDGLWGVIYKATEADDYVDDTYDSARQEVKAAGGLLWGAYHFFRPGNVPGQVEHFLRHAMPGPDTLLVLDHEDPACSLDDVKLFLRLVEERTGQRPALYSGHVLKEQIGDRIDSYLADTRLWLAQYGSELEVPANWPGGAWLWQFTDGNVGPQPHGIDGLGNCDVNSFNGTQAALKETWAEASIAPPRPQPQPPRPPMPTPDAVPTWLAVMRAITGMTETEGSADNPRIMHMADVVAREYPEQATYASYYTGDDVSWCGLAVAYCMTLAGIEPVFGPTDTDRWMWAQAWGGKYWQADKISSPRLGAVMVMTREGGGHVTLWEGPASPGYFMGRGGNQSDAVTLSEQSLSNVIAIMWPKAGGLITMPKLSLDATETCWVQSGLNLLENAGLDIDGEMGPATREAISKYQKDNGVDVTGLADMHTVVQMLEDLEEWNAGRAKRR